MSYPSYEEKTKPQEDPTKIKGQSCLKGSKLSTLTSEKEAKLKEPTLMSSAFRTTFGGKSQGTLPYSPNPYCAKFPTGEIEGEMSCST